MIVSISVDEEISLEHCAVTSAIQPYHKPVCTAASARSQVWIYDTDRHARSERQFHVFPWWAPVWRSVLQAMLFLYYNNVQHDFFVADLRTIVNIYIWTIRLFWWRLLPCSVLIKVIIITLSLCDYFPQSRLCLSDILSMRYSLVTSCMLAICILILKSLIMCTCWTICDCIIVYL